MRKLLLHLIQFKSIRGLLCALVCLIIGCTNVNAITVSDSSISDDYEFFLASDNVRYTSVTRGAVYSSHLNNGSMQEGAQYSAGFVGVNINADLPLHIAASSFTAPVWVQNNVRINKYDGGSGVYISLYPMSTLRQWTMDCLNQTPSRAIHTFKTSNQTLPSAGLGTPTLNQTIKEYYFDRCSFSFKTPDKFIWAEPTTYTVDPDNCNDRFGLIYSVPGANRGTKGAFTTTNFAEGDTLASNGTTMVRAYQAHEHYIVGEVAWNYNYDQFRLIASPDTAVECSWTMKYNPAYCSVGSIESLSFPTANITNGKPM